MIALFEKRIPFTLKRVACARGEPKDPELCALFAGLSPGGYEATVTVPLLEHDTGSSVVRLIESGPCAEYVDEAWPDQVPLWPECPRQRWAMRLFMDTTGNAGFLGVLFASDEEVAEKIEELAPRLKLVDACLEKHGEPGGPFFLGSRFSMADLLVAPMVVRWVVVGSMRGFDGLKLAQDLGLSRLALWAKAVSEHPSVLATLSADYVAAARAGTESLRVSYEVVDGSLKNVRAKV